MLLNFFVQGRESSLEVPDTYWEAATNWAHRVSEGISHLTWDQIVETVDNSWENSKQSFKYLIGTPVPVNPVAESPDAHAPQQEAKEEKSGVWKLTGMFDGLRGTRGPRETEAPALPDGKVYTEGEVHADLIRVSIYADLTSVSELS
jgi:mitochondrial import inner membrane translocase subunit TIM21